MHNLTFKAAYFIHTVFILELYKLTYRASGSLEMA